MAKARTTFICTNCGETFFTWSGKCSNCHEWNTLTEQEIDDLGGPKMTKGKPLKVQPVKDAVATDLKRLVTAIGDVDNVLGGGLVLGSINLLAGQPGIGKSTLLMQITSAIAENNPVLYVSGEESAHQVGLRAGRLKTTGRELEVVSSTSADDIAATISQGKYKLVVVDSIQSVTCGSISSAAGSVSQIVNSTQIITRSAKRANTTVILVGHVTKEGTIAGPKVLEHAVDVVLQLEGDQTGGFKILRANKNRYGSTSETGIFEMIDTGLKQVDNPSAALLAERQVSDGSIVLATIEGSRPILVEVQALVNPTSYGYPKRAASGFDLNRLNLLVAMLERRTKLKLSDQDIYINIVGGMQIREPAADLAICLAIGSASKGLQLKKNAVVFGEVGLSGEVRRVPQIDKRLAEAKKLGFDGAIGPISNTANKILGLNSVSNVRDALNQFLEKD